jgi:hypothetical protein
MTVLLDITEFPVFSLGQGEHVTGEPDGIPSGATIGTPALNAVVNPDGVASSATVGTVQVNVGVSVDSVESATVVGWATVASGAILYPDTVTGAVTVGEPRIAFPLRPTGIDAGSSIGTPQVNATINPDGKASTVTFGVPFVRGKALIFRGPTNLYKYRLWGEYEGISLLKKDGAWLEVSHPSDIQIDAADTYLGGGRDHRVSTSLAAELVGEGYTIVEEYV